MTKRKLKPGQRRYVYRYRNAKTGHWCTAKYAKAHPKTTVRERWVEIIV